MLEPILAKDYFNQADMKSKSLAGSFLCAWIVNIVEYNRIYKKVKPLMDAADAAEAMAKEKEAELAVVKEKVRQINEKVAELNNQLNAAEEKKRGVEAEA